MHVKKGDTVKIMSGKDGGKTGKVLATFAKTGRVTVEGLNIYVKHQRPKRSGEKGQKIRLPRPLQGSNLMLVCPHCGKVTRGAHSIDEKGGKTRICKKCGKRI